MPLVSSNLTASAKIEKMFVERQKILDTQCFLFYDSIHAERDALAAENARLREALEGMEQKA